MWLVPLTVRYSPTSDALRPIAAIQEPRLSASPPYAATLCGVPLCVGEKTSRNLAGESEQESKRAVSEHNEMCE